MSSRHAYRPKIEQMEPERLGWKLDWLMRAHTAKDPLSCAAVLVFSSLLRPDEALGLSWGDVDLKAGTVLVRRALTARGMRRPKVPRTVALTWQSSWVLQGLFDALPKRAQRDAAYASCSRPVFCDSDGRRLGREQFSAWWRERRDGLCMYGWTLADLRKAGIIYAIANAEAGR